MKTIFVMCLAVFAAVAHAEKAVIIGHGGTPCGDWIQMRPTSTGAIAPENMSVVANGIGMSQWLMGYLSGINAARISRGREAYDLPNYNSISAYVDKSCSDNPLQNLYQVALRLQLAVRSQEQSQGRGKD